MLSLSFKKATRKGDIRAKTLKKSVHIDIKEVAFIINDCIEKRIFSDYLKLADASPTQWAKRHLQNV